MNIEVRLINGKWRVLVDECELYGHEEEWKIAQFLHYLHGGE